MDRNYININESERTQDNFDFVKQFSEKLEERNGKKCRERALWINMIQELSLSSRLFDIYGDHMSTFCRTLTYPRVLTLFAQSILFYIFNGCTCYKFKEQEIKFFAQSGIFKFNLIY
jgi:hypothetical protein